MFGRIDWHPDRKRVRSFAVSLLVASLLFALLVWLAVALKPALIVAACGLGLAVVSWLLTPVGRVVYWVWMGISYAIGRITSPLFTGLIFFVAITPMGLLRRLGRSDRLGLKRQRECQSYFDDHERVEQREDFLRQF